MESKGEAFRAHPPPPSISSLPFPAHVSRASATAIQSEPRPPEGGPASRQTKASARESCGCPRTRQARAQLILRKREKLSLPTRTPARPSFATGLSISVSLSVSPLRPFVRPASVHLPHLSRDVRGTRTRRTFRCIARSLLSNTHSLPE